MNKPDAKLPNSTSQIHKRQEAIRLREQGKRIVEIATYLGVHPSTVYRWWQQDQQKSKAALKQQHRRAKLGKRRSLSPPEEATVQWLMQNHFPNELNIDSDLWTPQAVQALIACKCGVEMSIRTVGKYLKRWRYTPQKPLKGAYSLDRQAVKASLDEHPAIEQQAQQEDAEIAWGDESGLRSDAQVDEPREKVEINIDIDKSIIEQKVEETVTDIVETDEFQELNQKALTIRETIEINSEHQFEAQTPEHSTSSEETPIAQPAESIVVAPELASEAKTTAPLDPQFLEHCWQELSCCLEPSARIILEAAPLDPQVLEDCQQELNLYLEPFARDILEDILTEFPDITSERLIEKIAAEVLSTQRAQEFKNRMKLLGKSHSTSSVTWDFLLASCQSSPLPPTVVQPVIQQAKLPPDTKDSPQVQPVRAYLINVQTNRQIELPHHLFAIHIGRPNDRIPPDIDVSEFPNSEIVSRIHAVIHVEADRFYLEDMESSNGTYINKKQLLSGDRFCVKPGDRISLGKDDLVQFLFQMGTDFA